MPPHPHTHPSLFLRPVACRIFRRPSLIFSRGWRSMVKKVVLFWFTVSVGLATTVLQIRPHWHLSCVTLEEVGIRVLLPLAACWLFLQILLGFRFFSYSRFNSWRAGGEIVRGMSREGLSHEFFWCARVRCHFSSLCDQHELIDSAKHEIESA